MIADAHRLGQCSVLLTRDSGGVTGWMGAALAGVAAGLGVAMPLGAVGVLLVREGITRGWRPAATGGTAVALVDLTYATVALAIGTSIAALLGQYETGIHWAGAAVLVGVALWGLCRLRGAAPASPEARPRARVFARFVALTAVNPLTAVYFTVLAAGLGPRLATPATGAAFVLGVFAASWGWQLLLATAGALAGQRLSRRVQRWVSAAGYLIVVLYAARLALTA